MTLHTVSLSEALPQPWRNGGGVTRELLAWTLPSQPGPQDWTLRVSVADITQNGPFSAFPGIERCFTVLEGAGVALTLDGRALALRPGDDPLRFDGAAAPDCRLLDGPTRDLNLMVRASAGRAGMTGATVGATWHASAAWRGLYVHGAAEVDFGAGPRRLTSAGLVWEAVEPHTEAGAGSDHPVGWTLIRGGPAWWLWLDPVEHPR